MTTLQIGPHTLHLADAYQLRPTLGFFDADVMDPPYILETSGGGHFRKFRTVLEQISEQRLDQGFDFGIINPLLCGAAIVFASDDQLAELHRYLEGNFHRTTLLHWQKTNPHPMANRAYRSDVENYFHAWQRGYHPQGTSAEKLRVRRFTSPRGANRHDHPTCKPLDLMASIMVNVAGATVCDPFMGSGTTGVAAVQAGKVFTGIEHNPQHFATAAARIRAAWLAQQEQAA